MSREVRRVPLGFSWPLNEPWKGYLLPEFLQEYSCPNCENGYSEEGQLFYSEWYGNAPFDPRSMGSEPFAADGEAAKTWAEDMIRRYPQSYGSDEAAILRESERIVSYWNEAWLHHLSQDDVDALVREDRLWELTREFVPGEGWKDPEIPRHPTAAEVNRWSLFGMGHDSFNSYICIEARAKREGVPFLCATCDGTCQAEVFVGQRAAAASWVPTEVPSGEAWQLWESVSEGSPISPAFGSPEELAAHISLHPSLMGDLTADAALKWITESGWTPSGIFRKEASA